MRRGTGRIVCVGGATIDRKYRAKEPVQPETSNPVTSDRAFGGVARNVAENIARLGGRAALVSVVGDDENGRAILAHLRRLEIDTQRVAIAPGQATAEYVAVLQPNGDLALGLADMAILDGLTPERLRSLWGGPTADCIFADCNLPPETLGEIMDLARREATMLAVDAVSVAKVKRLPQDLAGVGLLLLNLDEARALLAASQVSPERAVDALLGCGAARVVLTLGKAGLIAADRSGSVRIGAAKANVADATGAGDALIAAILVTLLNGSSLAEAAWLGAVAAALTLESTASVRPDLSLALLESAMSRSSPPIV